MRLPHMHEAGRNGWICVKEPWEMSTSEPPCTAEAGIPLQLLSIVIPARNEEGCIRSTVEHLSLELHLKEIPHEIVVVDDGSTDRTWEILQDTRKTVPALHPVQNNAPH